LAPSWACVRIGSVETVPGDAGPASAVRRSVDIWSGHKDMQQHADNPLLFLDEAKARLEGYACEFIQARAVMPS